MMLTVHATCEEEIFYPAAPSIRRPAPPMAIAIF
jgi:hypothetical protein